MAVRKSIIIRFKIVFFLVLLGFGCAIYRMVKIMTVERDSWLALAAKAEGGDVDSIRTRVLYPERGNIMDENGKLITATIPYYNVFLDMQVSTLLNKEGKVYKENIDSLSLCLSECFKDKTQAEYKAALDRAYFGKNRRCRLVSRRVTYLELLEMKKFPILRMGRNRGGFYYESVPTRENLYGELASRTVGDINSDGNGYVGLEAYYDSLLIGKKGLEQGYRSGRKWIYMPEKQPEKGVDIVTTLNLEMQEICDMALREKMEEVDADNACLVLMEVSTGEIKAMVNLYKTSTDEYVEGWNMAVADWSEPGSTFKAMSFMIALDNGICDTSDVYDIHNGIYKFHGVEMRDHNAAIGGYDSLSVKEIFANSSNVGVSEIIYDYYKGHPEDFVDAILNTKFAENIDIQIPGASVPQIPHPKKTKTWSKVSLPWMSIGYGVQIPPIYTLNFYNAIANGGTMMRPYLVKEVRNGKKVIESHSPEVINQQICKEETVGKLQNMMEGVVEFGTARKMKSKEFKIAGKTGTAQLEYGIKGKKKSHQISFCGYFPADNPKYSCIVVFKKPKASISATKVCGMVFKTVAERIYARTENKKLSELEIWSPNDEVQYNSPIVKGGNKKSVDNALKNLNILYTGNDAEWVVFTKGKDRLLEQGCPIMEDLVPNVVGMGASDAVYLLEKHGLLVDVYGKGRVVKQSLEANKKIKRGSKIALELR